MDERLVRAIPWSVLAYLGNRVVTLGSTIVLARLLTPADFGVVALAALVVLLVLQVSGLGLTGAALQVAEYGRRERDVLTWAALIVGGGAAVLVLAAAGPLASALDEPRLAGVLRVMASLVIVEELVGVLLVDLQRGLRFRAVFALESLRAAGGAVLAVTAAALGAGVWSLVAGQVGGALLLLVALLAVTRPGLGRLDRTAARAMWRPAQGFLTQRVTTTLQQNADYLAVGSFLGARPLGFYSMAYRLSELPSNAIAETVARVTFPAFAQLKAAGRPFDDSFLTALRFVALTAVPLGVVLSATAEPFTRAVFGAKWEPMIGVLTVLGLWGAARPLQSTGEALLNSIGVAGLVGRLYVGVTLVVVPAMIVVAQLAGIRTVAAVLLVMAIGLAGVVARLVAAHAAVSVGRQWKAVRPALIGAAGMWVAGRAVAEAPLGVPAGVQLVLAVGAALAAYAVLVRALDPALTAHVRAGLLVLRRR